MLLAPRAPRFGVWIHLAIAPRTTEEASVSFGFYGALEFMTYSCKRLQNAHMHVVMHYLHLHLASVN